MIEILIGGSLKHPLYIYYYNADPLGNLPHPILTRKELHIRNPFCAGLFSMVLKSVDDLKGD